MATFGNSTSNQASESHAERIMISSAVAPSSGTVQSAVARLWLSSDGDIEDDHTDALFVIYADNNGEPGQLLAVSDVIEVDTFTEQAEHTFTFSGSNQIQVQEGETYWIGPGWRDINGVFFGRTSGGERWEYDFDWDQPPSDLTEEAPRDMNSGPMYAVVTCLGEGDGGDDEDPGLPPQNRRPANPGEALWIGDDPGKNHFNIGIGQDNAGVSGDTNHLDWDQDEIEGGFYSPDRFYLVEEGEHTWVRFKINAGAGRTSSGTQYPRSELRELEPDGGRIGWGGRRGWRRMKGISRVSQVTSVRPWVCFFQIHDASSDLIRVQTEGDPGQTSGLRLRARWTPPGGSDDQTTLPGWDGTYDVGDVLAWEIWIGGPTSADDGRCRIWINESLVLDLEDMGADGCYFKAGCYLQSNTHTRGEDPDDTASADILAGSFQVWHTGYPEPTEPVFTGPWIDGPPVNTTRFFLAG